MVLVYPRPTEMITILLRIPQVSFRALDQIADFCYFPFTCLFKPHSVTGTGMVAGSICTFFTRIVSALGALQRSRGYEEKFNNSKIPRPAPTSFCQNDNVSLSYPAAATSCWLPLALPNLLSTHLYNNSFTNKYLRADHAWQIIQAHRQNTNSIWIDKCPSISDFVLVLQHLMVYHRLCRYLRLYRADHSRQSRNL